MKRVIWMQNMKVLRKQIYVLAIPILIEQILITTMGMANTMLASNLKGAEGLQVVSAISMIDSFSYLFFSFFSALAIGGTVVVAQYVGRGNMDEANKVAKESICSGAIISSLLSLVLILINEPLIKGVYMGVESQVLDYAIVYFSITLLSFPFFCVTLICNGILRGAGDTKTAAISNVLMNIFNIVLTYIFLYGLELSFISIQPMGIMGAALGISLARVFGMIYVLWKLKSRKSVIQVNRLYHYKPSYYYLRQLFYVSIPACVESIVFHFGKLLTQVFISGMGTVAMSANSISNSIINLLNIPGNSLTTVATTIVGQDIGRGEKEEARTSLIFMTKLTVMGLVSLGLLSIPVAWFMVGLYTDNSDVLVYATNLIKLNALATPLWAFSFVLPGGLKGAGDGRYTMSTAIIGMWVFRVGFGYLLGIVFNLGVAGVFIAMYIDWAVRGLLYYRRLKGDKWLNHQFTTQIQSFEDNKESDRLLTEN